MGRTCRVCLRSRANERFGGRGVRAHICDSCRQMPKQERQQILLTDEIHGFMAQKNISAKNIARLKAIEQCGIAKVVLLAAIVREIASVAPGRRRRWKILRANHPDVLRLAEKFELVGDGVEWPDPSDMSSMDEIDVAEYADD